MDLIKKIFPLSFKYLGDVKSLIVGIAIYIIAAAVGCIAIGIASFIPLVGWLFATLGVILDLYVVGGIILHLLAFFKVIR